jgi:hypothetical protein
MSEACERRGLLSADCEAEMIFTTEGAENTELSDEFETPLLS